MAAAATAPRQPGPQTRKDAPMDTATSNRHDETHLLAHGFTAEQIAPLQELRDLYRSSSMCRPARWRCCASCGGATERGASPRDSAPQHDRLSPRHLAGALRFAARRAITWKPKQVIPASLYP